MVKEEHHKGRAESWNALIGRHCDAIATLDDGEIVAVADLIEESG